MSRAPPSVAPPPPEVDAKLMGLGINVDQRKRLMIAARLGIGPVGAAGLPGPKVKDQPPEQHWRSTSPPGPAGSTGYSAAQSAAADREKRRRELERKKEDDDDMDLQAFMGGCKKVAQRAEQEREKQRKIAEQKAKQEAMQAELRRKREAEAAANAAKARAAQKTAGPSEEAILAMLRKIAAAKAPALSSETCECGTPYVQGAKFCSECGRKRPAPQHEAPPPPEEKNRQTSEEDRRKDENLQYREEKKRAREEEDEATSSDIEESDRRPAKQVLIPARIDEFPRARFLEDRNSTPGEKHRSEEEVLAMLRKSKLTQPMIGGHRIR